MGLARLLVLSPSWVCWASTPLCQTLQINPVKTMKYVTFLVKPANLS